MILFFMAGASRVFPFYIGPVLEVVFLLKFNYFTSFHLTQLIALGSQTDQIVIEF